MKSFDQLQEDDVDQAEITILGIMGVTIFIVAIVEYVPIGRFL